MATNKEEFIKSLQNVKLVLGNGFDLYCGLYTKYSDFYCYNFNKFDTLLELFKRYDKNDSCDFSELDLDNVSIWDIFFMLNSSENPSGSNTFH